MGGEMKDFGSIFGRKWNIKRYKNQARKKDEQGRALFRKMGGPRGSWRSLTIPLWGVPGDSGVRGVTYLARKQDLLVI